jgi:hypothetical protein
MTPLHALADRWDAEAASSANNALDCDEEDIRARLEAEAETLTACAAELRAALAEGGWQTMESAPTDDRDILWCEGPGKPVSVVNHEHYGECFLHGLWQYCPEPPR